jgi:WD40 repeat protein
VAWSADGKTLASASWDRTVKLWDVATGQERATLLGHEDNVSAVAWSPDGKTVASAGFDKTIKLWDVSTGP